MRPKISFAAARAKIKRGTLAENTTIHPGMTIQPDVEIFGGSLPDGLCVEGTLDCTGNHSLKRIGSNTRIKGLLKLNDCISLDSIGANLRVDGESDVPPESPSLDLTGCSSLKAIGEHLRVNGDFVADGCSSLKSIGNGIYVNGDVVLSGCPLDIQLPQTGKIEGGVGFPDGFIEEGYPIPPGVVINGADIDSTKSMLNRRKRREDNSSPATPTLPILGDEDGEKPKTPFLIN